MKNGILSAYWPVIDGHADTMVQAEMERRSFFRYSSRGHLDLPRLRQAGVDLQVLAICAGNRRNPYHWAEKLLASWEKEYQSLPLPARPIWIKIFPLGAGGSTEYLRPGRNEHGGPLDNLENYARGIHIFPDLESSNSFAGSQLVLLHDSEAHLFGQEAIPSEKLGVLWISHLAP